MAHFTLALKQKNNSGKNVTFSHLMAAFLLIIMGAVSATIIRALSETELTISNTDNIYLIAALYVISGIVILFTTIKFNKKLITNKAFSRNLRIIEISLLSPILIYCLLKQWYVPAAYAGIGISGILYAFFYEVKITKTLFTEITQEGVQITNARTGFIPWKKINRLIIRHQILTIEVVGNKLVQLDLQKNESINFSEIEVFALERIKAEKKLIKNDW